MKLLIFYTVLQSLFCLDFNDGTMPGVKGMAGFFDGITSRIVIPAQEVAEPETSFSVDVWLCPVAFPKSECPIACRQDCHLPGGWSLWLDNLGNVHFKVACNDGWASVDGNTPLELRKWSRVTCVFHSGRALKIAVNGKETASLPIELPWVRCADYPLWVGRTPVRTPSFLEAQSIPIYSSFDGLMDELAIYDGREAYKKIVSGRFVRPDAPVLEERRLPSGPETVQFGAWYTQLKYYEAWDRQWRGESPDVVVGFGAEKPFKVVFWRGISYAPCFVTEKDNWMSNEFVERRKVTGWGCPESMSDKHADFSSVRILENTPARTVVLWRNSPVGVNQKFPYQSEETKWGDWSEETYIFYPDGTGVRKMVVWSSNFEDWHEWCQSLQVLHPFQRPEDVLDEDKIMSVASMDGRSKTYGWDFDVERSQEEPTIPGANIQVTYLKSTWNPFLILDDCSGRNEFGGDGPDILRYAGHWSDYSLFPWRNHWPVAQDYVIGRYAAVPDAASHTYTATQYSAARFKEEGRITKLMLCGCTDGDAEDLLPLAKSWLRAPLMKRPSGDAIPYDIEQRAYVLENWGGETLAVSASADAPVHGLCLVVNSWLGDVPSNLKINGVPCSDEMCKMGLHRSIDGQSLVIWVNCISDKPVSLSL